MVKCKKFQPTEPLVLNYDNLWMCPANEEELREICDQFNSIGCTSFQLSKEELIKALEELDKHGSNNI